MLHHWLWHSDHLQWECSITNSDYLKWECSITNCDTVVSYNENATSLTVTQWSVIKSMGMLHYWLWHSGQLQCQWEFYITNCCIIDCDTVVSYNVNRNVTSLVVTQLSVTMLHHWLWQWSVTMGMLHHCDTVVSYNGNAASLTVTVVSYNENATSLTVTEWSFTMGMLHGWLWHTMTLWLLTMEMLHHWQWHSGRYWSAPLRTPQS